MLKLNDIKEGTRVRGEIDGEIRFKGVIGEVIIYDDEEREEDGSRTCAKIKKDNSSGYDWNIYYDYEDEKWSADNTRGELFLENEPRSYKTNFRQVKNKKSDELYLVIWLEDEDPFQEFKTLEDAKEKIDQLMRSTRVKADSIRLIQGFEIGKADLRFNLNA